MDSLLKFTNDDEKILNDYEIISKDSKDYEKDVKDYPEIANQEVYKLKDISKEEQESLNQTIAKPLLALSSFEAPEEVSKEDMDLMLGFVENDDEILNSYTLSEDGNTYKINDISSIEKGKLNINLINGLLVKQMVSNEETANQIKNNMLENIPEEQRTVMENMSLAEIINMMPAEQKTDFINTIEAELPNTIDTMITNLSDSMVEQAAIQEVKLQYQYLGADTDSKQNTYILISGLQMLGIASITMISAISIMLLSSRVAAKLGKTLREKIFKKVLSFSTEEFNGFSTASLITRTTNDITQVQMVTMMLLRIVCFAPIIGIGALIKVLKESPSMTWIIAVVILVIFGVMAVAFAVVMPKFKIIQNLIDCLNLTMRENLSGMLVIRAFGNEKHSEDRFDKANKDVTNLNLFVNRSMASIMPIMMFIFNVVTLVIVYYGSKQIDLGNLAIGQMMAFMQYAMQIIMAFLMIAMIAIMLPRASVAANRVYEIIETKPTIQDPTNPVALDESKKGLVEFNHVSFAYPGASEPVLKDIDFVAKPGQTTAFIGSTGSGKSTLINLVPRFYEVSEGSIKVAGVDVREMTQHELRDRIGLVPQKGNLFSGTIRSNLKYGAPEATDEELEEVIRVAQAKEFIDQKEERFDMEISQGGTNVSGGQKQRLAIARAIAKNPDIYIFDDSFSALDFKTDAKLRQELNQLVKKTKSTVLLVGQRIASIMDADQIIVLDEGRIVGKGTHGELMKSCQVYQEIAYSQLSKEELSHE